MKNKRAYTPKEDYFKNPNTEKASYWAGFIAADGCIVNYRTGQSVIKIGLSMKDLSHLQKFDIGTPITFYKNSCWIQFSSNKIAKDLTKFNIVPRKSLILEFPKNMNKKNLRHFMRGYFDGDGCATHHSNPLASNKLRMRLLGTYDFLTDFVNNIPVEGINKNIIKVGRSNIYEIMWCKNSHLVYDFLYKNSTIFLERKKKRAEDLIMNSNINLKK